MRLRNTVGQTLRPQSGPYQNYVHLEFAPKFLNGKSFNRSKNSKISYFPHTKNSNTKKFKFWSKIQFWVKIQILVKGRNVRQKSKFDSKSKFLSKIQIWFKIEILVKNRRTP